MSADLLGHREVLAVEPTIDAVLEQVRNSMRSFDSATSDETGEGDRFRYGRDLMETFVEFIEMAHKAGEDLLLDDLCEVEAYFDRVSEAHKERDFLDEIALCDLGRFAFKLQTVKTRLGVENTL